MRLMIPDFMQAAMNDFVYPSIKLGEWHGIPIFYLEILASMHVYPLAYDEEEHKLYLNYGNDTISTTIAPDKDGDMSDSIKWFTTEMIKNHDDHEYVFSNEDGHYIPIFKNGCMEFFPKDPNNHAEEVACLIDQVITLYKIIMDLGDTINTLRARNKKSNDDTLNTSNCSSDTENQINNDNRHDKPVEHFNHFKLDKKDQLINSLSESNRVLIMKNRELDDKYNELLKEHEKLKESVKDHNKILADYEKLKDDYNTLSDRNATLTKLNKTYEEKSIVEDKIVAAYAKREELYNKAKNECKNINDVFADFLINALNGNKDFKKKSNIIHSAPSDINNDNKDDLTKAEAKSVKKIRSSKFVVYIKRSDIGIACLDDTTGCMYDPLDGSIISTDVNEENYTIFNINGRCAAEFIKHLLSDLNGEDNDWK